MSDISVLNNVDHANIKIRVSGDALNNENINRCQVYASEITELQKEFPVLIYRDEATGALQLHAILGLAKNENLFLTESGWSTRFVPALLARGPFSIGYSKNDNGEPTDPKICVDMHDDRVNTTSGESVFLPMGGESQYLQYVKTALQTIETGAQYNRTLFTLITELDLLEPVTIQIKLSDDEQVNLNNYYSINQQKLSSLADDQLSRLNQYGILGLLFFILSSMGNFQRLIELKNAKSAGL